MPIFCCLILFSFSDEARMVPDARRASHAASSQVQVWGFILCGDSTSSQILQTYQGLGDYVLLPGETWFKKIKVAKGNDNHSLG